MIRSGGSTAAQRACARRLRSGLSGARAGRGRGQQSLEAPRGIRSLPVPRSHSV